MYDWFIIYYIPLYNWTSWCLKIYLNKFCLTKWKLLLLGLLKNGNGVKDEAFTSLLSLLQASSLHMSADGAVVAWGDQMVSQINSSNETPSQNKCTVCNKNTKLLTLLLGRCACINILSLEEKLAKRTWLYILLLYWTNKSPLCMYTLLCTRRINWLSVGRCDAMHVVVFSGVCDLCIIFRIFTRFRLPTYFFSVLIRGKSLPTSTIIRLGFFLFASKCLEMTSSRL